MTYWLFMLTYYNRYQDQQEIMNQYLSYKLDSYSNNQQIRIIINIVYIWCEIVLSLYLLFIPIQIAYYWKLKTQSEHFLQNALDIIAVVSFFVHIILYMDEKIIQWLKSPYIVWYSKLITLELAYDLACLILAVYALAVPNFSIIERVIELIFFFKIYKLVKFDIKCMYIVIGTKFYWVYKILRTLLIMFMAISYVGSLFYGLAYYLYITNPDNQQLQSLLWIVSCPALSDIVKDYSFIIQLEYAMYWALGTASTAAYGDISAAQPLLVLINILALAFEGFLFGFYLNSMHSIPNERKQKQANLLEKFDSFQQHCSNRKIDKKLYLQILCSLEHTESQKKRLDSIEKLLPKKYLQEIKSSIYQSFICDPTFFGSTQFQLQISEKVTETVSQMGEDIYNYRNIKKDDLLFIKQGSVKNYMDGEIQYITKVIKNSGYYIGLYQFTSGLHIPQRAICLNYCLLYKIGREEYKALLTESLKLEYTNLQMRAMEYSGGFLERQPIIKLIKHLEEYNSDCILFRKEKKIKAIMNNYEKQEIYRKKYERYNYKNKGSKFYRPEEKKRKNKLVQTENIENIFGQVVYIWNYNRSNPQNSQEFQITNRIIFSKIE